MKVMTMLRILLLFFVLGNIYINVEQGSTIAEQRQLLRALQEKPCEK
jgi:hypothetical protein